MWESRAHHQTTLYYIYYYLERVWIWFFNGPHLLEPHTVRALVVEVDHERLQGQAHTNSTTKFSSARELAYVLMCMVAAELYWLKEEVEGSCLFDGHVHRSPCPYFPSPVRSHMPPQQATALIRILNWYAWVDIMDGHGCHFLVERPDCD